ncbi:MAG: nucleotidyl transferase AbiEii/AbiGii toxin family protein [Lachnospiraceae bacterium]|nr:nucleotidyl transferase AbiEii/AbiGii toxin family protein [Lachnospiraceae bacterium]
MFLHENREIFQDLIINAAHYTGKENTIVEKDYYITLILHNLSNTYDNCVFKGGTSLSKGFRVIDRFSEDVDITFDEHIGKQRRKKLKHETMKSISENLRLPIENCPAP